MTTEQVLKKLREQQGDLSGVKFAHQLGVSVGYLADVYRRRRDPGPAILKHLGLHRVVSVTYEQSGGNHGK